VDSCSNKNFQGGEKQKGQEAKEDKAKKGERKHPWRRGEVEIDSPHQDNGERKREPSEEVGGGEEHAHRF